MTEPAPERVRVTGPPQRAGRRAPRTSEIDDQTAARRGADGLADPGPAAAGDADPAAGAGLRPRRAPRLPPRARAWPTYASSACPLAWLLLGGLVYPFLFAARPLLRPPGRAQRAGLRRPRRHRRAAVRRSDRERHRPQHRRGRPGHRRHAGDRHLGAAVLAHHQRLLRRLADGPAGASTPRRSAASTSPPRPSSASPAWCSRSAPTCSGTPSAGPPATSSCWSWSPRRCAARAPTRCPTSPRPGWPRRRVRAASLAAGGGDRLALPAAAVPGRRRWCMEAALGAPRWLGAVVVAVVVLANVLSGGMRSITFVQAFQYWLKLTALLVPAVVLLGVWVGDGAPNPADAGRRRRQRHALVAAAGQRRRRGPLRDVLADRRDVPRHHGPAARGGPLLHQPRRPRRPPYDAGGAGPARHLLPAAAGLRRARPGVRRVRRAPTSSCWSCRG